MITTLDGVVKKKGDKVWEVGVTLDGVRLPTLGIVDGGKNAVTNPCKCWAFYDNCYDYIQEHYKKRSKKVVKKAVKKKLVKKKK
jgi:hypothetical protein